MALWKVQPDGQGFIVSRRLPLPFWRGLTKIYLAPCGTQNREVRRVFATREEAETACREANCHLR